MQRTYYDEFKNHLEDNEELLLLERLIWLAGELKRIDDNSKFEDELNNTSAMNSVFKIRRDADRLFRDFVREINENVGFYGTSEQTQRYLNMVFNTSIAVHDDFRKIYYVDVVRGIYSDKPQRRTHNVHVFLDTILYVEKKLDDLKAIVESKLSEITPENSSTAVQRENREISEGTKGISVNRSPDYVIDSIMVIKLYRKFGNIWWTGISEEDFLSCFDKNLDPPIKLAKTLTRGSGNKFGYFLSCLKEKHQPHGATFNENDLISETVAVRQFGFDTGRYKGLKSESKERFADDTSFNKQIVEILKAI